VLTARHRGDDRHQASRVVVRPQGGRPSRDRRVDHGHQQALAAARAGNWLAPEALIVVEEAATADFAAPEGFDELERRRYDDSALIVLRHRG